MHMSEGFADRWRIITALALPISLLVVMVTLFQFLA